MEIIKGHIDWMEGYANSPNIYFYVDKLPKYEDWRWQVFNQQGELNGQYLAVYEDALVQQHVQTSNHEGYGGAKFPITMVDGTERTLIGPWSGASMNVNTNAKFGHQVVEVGVKEITNTDRFSCWTAYYATIPFLTKYAARIDIGPGYNKPNPNYKRTLSKEAFTLDFTDGTLLFLKTCHCHGPVFNYYTAGIALPDGTVFAKEMLSDSSYYHQATEHSVFESIGMNRWHPATFEHVAMLKKQHEEWVAKRKARYG